MNNELTVAGVIQNGLLTGLKNAVGLLGAVGLWLLTLWIPYLNVGTTIGLLGLVAAMSRGEAIRPTEIFEARYRERMGEFFLVIAFIGVGVLVGLAFVGVPGIVIWLTWSMAPLLVIDQGLNPAEALTRSNELTRGKKVTLFFGLVLTNLAVSAAVMLVTRLGGMLWGPLGALFAIAGYVLSIAVGMGANAYVYGTLNGTWKSDREVKQGPVIGAAIGTIVGSFIVVFVISAISGHYARQRWEEEYESRKAAARYDYAPPQPEPTRIAPPLQQDPVVPAKNVASSKTRRTK